MFLNVLISWVILLGCIYLSYQGLREVEVSLVRRPFSVLLMLLAVTIGVGLLEMALDFLSGNWISEAFGYGGYYENRIYSIIALGLAAGSGVLIRRDMLLRIRQSACPQCNTPLLGRTACPNCGWGSIRLPVSLGQLVGRLALPTPAAGGSAPTMLSLAPTPHEAASPSGSGVQDGQSAGFCIMCGTALTAGQTFCAQCGTPAPTASGA